MKSKTNYYFILDGTDEYGPWKLLLVCEDNSVKFTKRLCAAMNTPVLRLGGEISAFRFPDSKSETYAHTLGMLTGKLKCPEWFDVGPLAFVRPE